MTEVILAVALSLAGAGVLSPVRHRLPRLALAAMAFPVGAAVHMLGASMLLAVTGTVSPGVALAATSAAGVAGFVVGWRRLRPDRDQAVLLAMAVGAAAAVAWVAWNVHMTRLTPDSLRYLLGAADFQLPAAATQVHPNDLMKRQLGLQVLHGMASFTPRNYVAFVGPLFGASGVGFFAWLLWSRMRDPWGHRVLVVGAAVGFLLASNRLLYNFFYINTHMAVATLMLIAVAGAWLSVADDEPWWALPAGLSLAAVLLLRPEAPLLASLVLVPLAASRAGWTVRWLMTVPSLAVLVLWYGVVLWRHFPGGSQISLTAPVFGNVAVLVLSTSAVVIAGLGVWPRLVRWGDVAFVPLVAAALVVYVALDPQIFADTASATASNLVLVRGLWMLAWPVAIVLLAIALPVHRVPNGRLWTTPIVGFVLLFFLLPYIREGAWRVGAGDSGNRILTHMFMVVVAFIVLAFAGDRSETEPSGETHAG